MYNYFSNEELENIIHSCNLGFSANFTDKKELSKEGMIAQDADRLDAIGIARTFAYGGKKGDLIYNPEDNETVDEMEYNKSGSRTSISHFYDKQLRIKDMMNTETAKEIAIGRHKYQEKFLEQFFDEWNGKK